MTRTYTGAPKYGERIKNGTLKSPSKSPTSASRGVASAAQRPLDEDRTLVRLVMSYEPEGVIENVGDAIGALSSQVEASVEDFKHFIEARGSETGAWRGEVSDGEPRRSSEGRQTESEKQNEDDRT